MLNSEENRPTGEEPESCQEIGGTQNGYLRAVRCSPDRPICVFVVASSLERVLQGDHCGSGGVSSRWMLSWRFLSACCGSATPDFGNRVVPSIDNSDRSGKCCASERYAVACG